jgi:hypothetical protein
MSDVVRQLAEKAFTEWSPTKEKFYTTLTPWEQGLAMEMVRAGIEYAAERAVAQSEEWNTMSQQTEDYSLAVRRRQASSALTVIAAELRSVLATEGAQAPALEVKREL